MLGDIVGKIGPGIVLSASIVGSGELIATTTLGAEVGYTVMWLIIFSCLIKALIQSFLGRYTIAKGETGLAAFNRIPGKIGRVNWVVWAWAAMVVISLFQFCAMFVGIAQVMKLLTGLEVVWWVIASSC
ncbi:MAG TPA: Nramp family divalent metal transporter [Castellaniella sp.]|nr:Nramp family divalent metal transporter [Castellaniella sp.]